MEFELGETVALEESLTCELKEVRGSDPVNSIAKEIDQYAVAFLNERGGSIYWGVRDHDRVVTGVTLDHMGRDHLRQVIGQKLGAIAPPIPSGSYDLPLHPVRFPAGHPEDREVFVVEMQIREVALGSLYLTGNGEAYRKVLGGKKKLGGAELLAALVSQLEKRQSTTIGKSAVVDDTALLPFPSVLARARHVRPLLSGSRVLWVDDNPGNNLYARVALATMGLSVDIATSTNEAVALASVVRFDAIISDIHRGSDPKAGLTFLSYLRSQGNRTPLIFFIGAVSPSLPVPTGAFALTNVTSDLFHYLFDVLERRSPGSA